MPGILYRLIGNDVNDYDRLIRNPETPEVLRSLVLSAIPYHIKYEGLSREKYTSLLHDYLRLGIDEANEKFVTNVICDLPDGSTVALPLAKEVFEKDLVDLDTVDWPFIEAHLHDMNPVYDRVTSRVKADYSDIVKTLGNWAWFTESKPKPVIPPLPPSLRSFDSAFISPPHQQQKEHIGRNDRYPCGSGKKYKKCCMNRKAVS